MPTIRSSEEARELIARRWAKPRPAPKDSRVRTLPSGSAVEKHWMQRAVELELVPEGMSRDKHRRVAKRLSDSDVAMKIARVHQAQPSTLSDDDALLLTHLEREASMWRARARRDRQIALAHELLADVAEAALAELVADLEHEGPAEGSIEDDFGIEAAP